VDFTEADTFRDVLGFYATLEPAVPTNVLVIDLAPNQANFNNIEYFLIHWDGGQGFMTNWKFQQTIAKVVIDAKPGSQITYSLLNPAKSEANGWIGHRRNHISLWLTDESGTKLVNTGGSVVRTTCHSMESICGTASRCRCRSSSRTASEDLGFTSQSGGKKTPDHGNLKNDGNKKSMMALYFLWRVFWLSEILFCCYTLKRIANWLKVTDVQHL
jgi:hypothetical protein